MTGGLGKQAVDMEKQALGYAENRAIDYAGNQVNQYLDGRPKMQAAAGVIQDGMRDHNMKGAVEGAAIDYASN